MMNKKSFFGGFFLTLAIVGIVLVSAVGVGLVNKTFFSKETVFTYEDELCPFSTENQKVKDQCVKDAVAKVLFSKGEY